MAWSKLRGHYWGALVFDVAVIVTSLLLIHTLQTKNLPYDEPAPPLELGWLDDSRMDTILVPGSTGVVYFFAPWCIYCKSSIDNMQNLVSSGKLAWARAVALDYSSDAEVREFIRNTGLGVPVLMGNAGTARDWQVRAFPTYFVIDGDGRVVARSVGYSTRIGLQTRLWMYANQSNQSQRLGMVIQVFINVC